MIVRNYYSQPATSQDRWVIETLGERRNGYFVEIGAHDGLSHSNTATLEFDFDWNGLLVEPDPIQFEQLEANRPKSTLVKAAICDMSGEGVLVQGGMFSGLTQHMPPDWMEEHRRRHNPWITVKTMTLVQLLTRNRCPQIIDYLSIDVEGAELAILEPFFSEGHNCNYKFRCITVEFRYDRFLLKKLEHLMKYDYELGEVRAFDACFVWKGL